MLLGFYSNAGKPGQYVDESASSGRVQLGFSSGSMVAPSVCGGVLRDWAEGRVLLRPHLHLPALRFTSGVQADKDSTRAMKVVGYNPAMRTRFPGAALRNAVEQYSAICPTLASSRSRR